MKSKNLNEAKRAKKQLGEDELALLNRIKLLEREEQDALKKAEEAQKQARDIFRARQEKAKQLQEKEEIFDKQDRELSEKKRTIHVDKEKRRQRKFRPKLKIDHSKCSSDSSFDREYFSVSES